MLKMRPKRNKCMNYGGRSITITSEATFSDSLVDIQYTDWRSCLSSSPNRWVSRTSYRKYYFPRPTKQFTGSKHSLVGIAELLGRQLPISDQTTTKQCLAMIKTRFL